MLILMDVIKNIKNMNTLYKTGTLFLKIRLQKVSTDDAYGHNKPK